MSRSTKHRIQTELERAVQLAELQDLETLCAPYSFFQDPQYKGAVCVPLSSVFLLICLPAFVRVEAVAESQAGLEKWTGWVESQLRKIIPKLEFAPFVRHAVPRNKPTTEDSQPLAVAWWLGLAVDPPRLQADGSRAPRGQIDLKVRRKRVFGPAIPIGVCWRSCFLCSVVTSFQGVSNEWTAMVMAFKDRSEDMKVSVSVVLPRQLPPAFAPPPRKKKKLETAEAVATAHPSVLVPPSPLLLQQHQQQPAKSSLPPPPAASTSVSSAASFAVPEAVPSVAKRARVDMPLLGAAVAPEEREAEKEPDKAGAKISIRLSSKKE